MGVKDLLFAVCSICSLLNAVCVQIPNPYSIENLNSYQTFVDETVC